MKFIAIKDDYTINGDIYSYIGVGPYATEHDARMAILNNFYESPPSDEHKMEVEYFHNETRIRFTSTETGELFADYYILVTML